MNNGKKEVQVIEENKTLLNGYNNHIEHYIMDGEYYDYFAFNKFMVEEIKRRYEEILFLAKLKDDSSILDIGSGGGEIIKLLRNKTYQYHPVDLSHNNLKRIKEKAEFTIYPTNSDVYLLPYKDDTFNLIIMSEVLEHLSNPARALDEVQRILNPNGKLIITVPYKELISIQLCIHCNKPTPTHSHLHSFTKESLFKLVSNSNLHPYKLTKNVNKVINRLHINYYLKGVPFIVWKCIDNLFNLIIDKPASMILVSKK